MNLDTSYIKELLNQFADGEALRVEAFLKLFRESIKHPDDFESRSKFQDHMDYLFEKGVLRKLSGDYASAKGWGLNFDTNKNVVCADTFPVKVFGSHS